MQRYRERVTDALIERKLEGKGAVLIEGAKWCGKTTTAIQHAGSMLKMDDPQSKNQNLQTAEIDPVSLLKGKTPLLIDEWQLAPKLWDAIRFEVDKRGETGQFLLTGSSVPCQTEDISHSGIGRFARLRMRPMSLYESGDSNGQVSLETLFDNADISGKNEIDFERLAFLVCRGGWPAALDMRDTTALDQAFDYCEAVVSDDISRVDNVRRKPERVARLMQSYARNQATQASIETICKDMAADDMDISAVTVSEYMSALRKMFVIEDLKAWNPNLRSKTAVRSSDTRFFVDPSIATAMLGIAPKDLTKPANINTFGLMFETMCIRDLRVYAQSLLGDVRRYRDKNGLECDAVIHLRNGQYGLAEIKLGGDSAIEEAAATLHKLASKIDTTKMPAPAFLMIVLGTALYAFRRKDGIYVVPAGCLKN